MAKGLTKKQQERLSELDQSTLLTIVQQLISDNPEVQKRVINGWLSEPDELLSRLNTRYHKLTKSSRFYDYYEADDYFEALICDIVQPMALNTETKPAQVEALAAKMLLSFESLCEHVDTSSGSWQNYTFALFEVWLKSIVALRSTRAPEESARAIFAVASQYDWFDAKDLKEWRSALGSDVLYTLARLFEQQGQLESAATLLLIVRDVDAAKAMLSREERPTSENVLELAALLLDELRAPEAIEILHKVESYIAVWSGEYARWTALMVSALLEEGDKEMARQTARNAFARSPAKGYWELYLKAGGDAERDFPLFLQQIAPTAHEAGFVFLENTQHYKLLSDIIIGAEPEGITLRLPAQILGSFWRKLSSTLYQQGYAQAAVILRRKLAEYSIGRASRKHYTYAANDAKKAIDYCAELENQPHFMGSGAWLQALYEVHSRKYSLWDIMQEKIAGLGISKTHGLTLSKE